MHTIKYYDRSGNLIDNEDWAGDEQSARNRAAEQAQAKNAHIARVEDEQGHIKYQNGPPI